MYIQPFTTQKSNYTTLILCDNIPQNLKALDFDNEEHYVLTPKPVLRATPTLFEPKQIQYATNSNTFTAQEAGIRSIAELTKFWNGVFFAQHSYTILKFLGKAIHFDCLAASKKHPSDFYSPPNRNQFNLDNASRFGLRDHLINIAPLFAPDGFADAFSALFGFLCFIPTHCGFYFSILLFLHYVITFILKFYKSISIE